MYFLAAVNCEDPNIKIIMGLVGTVITLIQIAIPIILIIMGSIDLGKAVFAGKEDEIKKNQQVLVKRAIAAVLVFFVATLVYVVMGFVANALGGEQGKQWQTCWEERNK